MKFGITINIGNFESIRFDSSDHENIILCVDEVIKAMEYQRIYFKQIGIWLDLLKKQYVL